MRYLEYEESTGHILCEIESGTEPAVGNGHAVIPAPEEWDGDILGWTVKDGALTCIRSTELERLEAERNRRAQQERAQWRLQALINEFNVAMLDEDEDRVAELRAEFRRLKALL